MRMPPEEVIPIVHQGVRYRAPHDATAERSPWDPAVELRLLEQAGHDQATTLADPAWVDRTLGEMGLSAAEREAWCTRIRVAGATNAALQAVLARKLPEMLGGGLAGFELPKIEAEDMQKELVAAGLSPSEVDLGVSMWRESQPGAQQGGVVIAEDVGSGKELWRLPIYSTTIDPSYEEDVQWVFITQLDIQGDQLLVRDERRRVHVVDLSTRTVVDSQTDHRPTPAEQAEQTLKSLPDETWNRLSKEMWQLKTCLDQMGMARHSLVCQLRDFLNLLQPHCQHPLVQTAYDVASERLNELRNTAATENSLYDWLQKEGAVVWGGLWGNPRGTPAEVSAPDPFAAPPNGPDPFAGTDPFGPRNGPF